MQDTLNDKDRKPAEKFVQAFSNAGYLLGALFFALHDEKYCKEFEYHYRNPHEEIKDILPLTEKNYGELLLRVGIVGNKAASDIITILFNSMKLKLSQDSEPQLLAKLFEKQNPKVQLFIAIMKDDPLLVKECLKLINIHEFKITFRGCNDANAFQIAVMCHAHYILNVLLEADEKKTLINHCFTVDESKNKNYHWPRKTSILYLSLFNKNEIAFKKLLPYVDINKEQECFEWWNKKNLEYKRPLLHQCIQEKNLDLIKYIFDTCKNLDFDSHSTKSVALIRTKKNKDGLDIEEGSLLHHAVYRGHTEIVRFFCQNNKLCQIEKEKNYFHLSDIYPSNIGNPYANYEAQKNNLLHIAASKGFNRISYQRDTSERFFTLQHQFHCFEENDSLTISWFQENEKVDKRFTKDESKEIIRFLHSEQNIYMIHNIELITLITSKCNCTPAYERIEIFKILLNTPSFKDLINQKNSKGDVPLHLAANAEIAQLLLDIGANPDIINNDNFSPWQKTYTNDDVRKVIMDHVSRLAISIASSKQNTTGEYSSYSIYRQCFDGLQDETKSNLDILRKKEIEDISYISPDHHVLIYLKTPPILRYSSNNRDDEKKRKKSISIDANSIHSYLTRLHGEERSCFIKNSKSDNKFTTNFIFAALTFIFTDKPQALGGDHGRITVTLILNHNQRYIKCNEDNEEFLQKVSNRLMASGSLEKSKRYLEHLHKKATYTKTFAYNNNPVIQKGEGFSILYMHSENALCDYLTQDSTLNALMHSLSLEIQKGSKLYAIILDIHSTKKICENACKETLFGFQNSKRDRKGFMYLLTRKLVENGYTLPVRRDNNIKIITRFSFEVSDNSITYLENEPRSIELNDKKNINDKILSFFFKPEPSQTEIQEEIKVKQIWKDSSYPYTFFISGSKNIDNSLSPDKFQEQNNKPSQKSDDILSEEVIKIEDPMDIDTNTSVTKSSEKKRKNSELPETTFPQNTTPHSKKFKSDTTPPPTMKN